MNTGISTYNVRGGLGEIGNAIGLEIVHGMTDARDVREFVTVNKALSSLCSDENFAWYSCPTLARSYTLQMVLRGEIPAVCNCYQSLILIIPLLLLVHWG